MPVEVRLAAAQLRLRYAAPLFTLAAAVVFLVTRPPVGDFWAARARQSAAAHGVGLQYWFSWFGGTIPGHYSVIDSLVTKFVDAGLLGAVSTVAITPICYRLLRGTPHQLLGTWLAAIATVFSLWSGRVPFALGTVLMISALLAVRAERRTLAALLGIAAALASPVSGAFLIIGLTGVVLHDQRRRTVSLWALGAAGISLLVVAFYFGTPGPQSFSWGSAAVTAGSIAVLLVAKPPQYIRTVLILSLAACPLLVLIPNGMGSNFERFTWICLPVAVAATARARMLLVVLSAGAATACGVVGSVHDLVVAAQPNSNIAYYDPLNGRLDHTSGLADYRVEVVSDGVHVAAYALLNHALLARGYETQSDNAFNSVLASPSLDATTFKLWLDNNAVGYVAIDRKPLVSGPEYRLVRSGTLPYLHQVWSDAHWQLFRVSDASPIVAPPARVVVAAQARLVISAPRTGTFALRVRWSRFLQVRGPQGALLRSDGQGWTTLAVTRPGSYVIS
ncbi:MAG TPA: hypothetical protein VKB75_07570 [Jatrophihabitans sp.]|nr:hypothetical protein [Jatrophihabitans sp.]